MRAEEKKLGRVFHLEFDEDEDFFARAKEICDDYKNVIKIINKYQK